MDKGSDSMNQKQRAITPEQERLYGVPGAEHLHFDPATTYETDIEPWLDDGDTTPRLIEEWSVKDSVEHLPTADALVEWVVEWAGECGELDEDGYEDLASASKSQDVEDAAVALLAVLASKVRYRMADKHLSTLTVTWDADGDPLLDGKPMYVPNEDVCRGVLRLMGAAL